MTSNTIASGIVKAILVLTGIALLLYFLYQIQVILIYVVVSIILTMIGTPIIDFLKKKLKFKNTLAVMTTLFFYALLVFGFIMMFIPLVTTQGQKLSLLNVHEFQTQLNQLTFQAKQYLLEKGLDGDKLLKDYNVMSKFNFGFLSDFLNSLVSTISNIGMGIASVFFITFFFLKEREGFIKLFRYVIPDKHEDKILNSIEKINELLSRYFLGLLAQLFIVFVLYLIVLLIFGIENATIIALLCAILNIIPYIGPLIASVLAVTLSLLGNFDGHFTSILLSDSIYVLIGFFVVQLIDNNISQPFIFSNSTKSHPLEIFLIILIFGILFGIAGMIVAVPLYTILKVIAKEFMPDNKIIQSLTKDL